MFASARHPLDTASPRPVASSRPNGKYAFLTDCLLAPNQRTRRAINATFQDVEQILGFPRPESAYNYQPYWQGLTNPLARAVLAAAGWQRHLAEPDRQDAGLPEGNQLGQVPAPTASFRASACWVGSTRSAFGGRCRG
jgi:hypothetical protein